MNNKTKALVGTGILTAIVIVLQTLASGIKLGPFSITLVLVPIIVGAALYGAKTGAWLGFVFGVVVLIHDAAAFLAINTPGTIITCLLKGILAGLASAVVYKLFANKNKWVAVFSAAIVCPVVNTGVFLLGCLIFFYSTIQEWATGAGFGSAGAYMIFGLAGLNFLTELVVNIVLAPAVLRIIDVVTKSKKKA